MAKRTSSLYRRCGAHVVVGLMNQGIAVLGVNLRPGDDVPTYTIIRNDRPNITVMSRAEFSDYVDDM